MGAWGIGNFDNDTACDWAYNLKESNNLSLIEKSINAVFDEEYIDADDGCEALAAIDTMTRLMNKGGVTSSYTENVDNWVSANSFDVPPSLVEKAKKAIPLLISEQSELFELWSDSGEFDSWKAEVESLLEKLNA